MTDKADTGAGESSRQHQFDEYRLLGWLEAFVEGFAGPLTIERFKGGQSNPTYKLVTPDHAYVLRSKPPGVLLRGAHAVDREYRVITALAKTAFPVAATFGFCDDETIIGTPFYIMDCVEGRVIWDTSFPDAASPDRHRYFDAMNATIAALHNIDYKALGLEDFGKPGNYFERQVRRWSQQYLEDKEAGRNPDMDRLVAWLPENIPPGDATTLVHGDFRCDNLMFHASEPRVVAVLDWELATLGHPLADFTYHAMMYRVPPAFVTGLAGVDLAANRIPSEAEYVEAYCARTGRTEILHYDFYIAYNMFRLAAIFHGIKGRYVRGNAASEHAQSLISNMEPLAALAWKQAQRAGA